MHITYKEIATVRHIYNAQHNVTYYVAVQTNCSTNKSDWYTYYDAQHTNLIVNRETLQQVGFNIYPIPSSGQVTMSFNALNNSDAKISVYNELGRNVFSKLISLQRGNNVVPLNLNNLSNGIYIVKLINNENTFHQKLLLNK